ncbi:hypothetical protein TNCV_1711551 [Trichonephila clavipes]|nr:hypothetical protein TNCV_1711551 [Trichonephila clavipes]
MAFPPFEPRILDLQLYLTKRSLDMPKPPHPYMTSTTTQDKKDQQSRLILAKLKFISLGSSAAVTPASRTENSKVESERNEFLSHG